MAAQLIKKKKKLFYFVLWRCKIIILNQLSATHITTHSAHIILISLNLAPGRLPSTQFFDDPTSFKDLIRFTSDHCAVFLNLAKSDRVKAESNVSLRRPDKSGFGKKSIHRTPSSLQRFHYCSLTDRYQIKTRLYPDRTSQKLYTNLYCVWTFVCTFNCYSQGQFLFVSDETRLPFARKLKPKRPRRGSSYSA